MAVIKQGILGGFSGSVAGVVGSSWKGIAVMKAKPLSVSNPRTAAQIGQRNKMAATVAFLQPILGDIIKPLNDRFAGKMSGFNYSLQGSIAAFSTAGDLYDPELIRISRAANKAQLIDAIAHETTKVRVTWTSDEGTGFALATDKMYVVVYDLDDEVFYVSAGLTTRTDEVCDVDTGVAVSGHSFAVYAAALRADGTIGFAQSYYGLTV